MYTNKGWSIPHEYIQYNIVTILVLQILSHYKLPSDLIDSCLCTFNSVKCLCMVYSYTYLNSIKNNSLLVICLRSNCTNAYISHFTWVPKSTG